jgi:CHASE2 domain-containing sensor protein
MQWFVHESTRGPRYLEDSLAFAAAEAHATSRGTKERLYRLRNAGYHPFISFLGQHEFTVANAEKLTCGSVGADQKRSSKCVKGEGDPAEQAKVQGRVALLGFTYDHSDLTTTVVGKMPGVVLQANYIEALVAGRTFSPLAPWIQWLLGSIWFVVSESMLWRFGPATLRGLTTWALVSFFAMVLIYYFVPVNTAHYVDMAPPSVFLVAARAVNERIEYIRLKLRPAAAEGVVP